MEGGYQAVYSGMSPEWLSRACGSHCRAKDCMEKAMVL
ncbi:hypothetical protein HMPREF1246_0837 [Acidaminococcus sp. BV3L6]|nr:hypothetical protein HMPREF1246_0837 [Acidaminococcus sp. BV3L6]